MILQVDAPKPDQQRRMACAHCCAFNHNKHFADMPSHVYAEQGFVLDAGLAWAQQGERHAITFTPFRCADPACATLWLRADHGGQFIAWIAGS